MSSHAQDADSLLQAQLAAADPEQLRLMAEDCILIDDEDQVVGHASKKDCHLNTNIFGPDAMLHRAFSVFIFDDDFRLLMQQRADSKITFPAFWANTCCSHPLYVADELEEAEQMGVRRAAQRKLEQELGIPAEDVPLDSFHFVSRVHYRAASDTVWGEHEIDYILFCRPPRGVTPRPNANEVQSVRWFTPTQLRQWLARAPASGDLVSPWFKAIADYRLFHWWDLLAAGDWDALLADRAVIHRVSSPDDAPSAPAPASSSASAASASPAVAKQGAYGRVKTHKHSLWETLARPAELMAAVRYKLGRGLGGGPVSAPPSASPELTRAFAFCDEILVHVSRSFAAVIQQLPAAVRRAVCVFYLVLRGLDTVEDDTTVAPDTKRESLRSFHSRLGDEDFAVRGVGAGEERRLLEEFGQVARAFNSLPAGQQAVIADVCRAMGEGMASFVGTDLSEGTASVAHYNRYCHYVAGLVGEGLSHIFAETGMEHQDLRRQLELANHMGLFLQKTNIIRDYLEDLVEGRAFWPRDVWSKHAPRLADLADPARSEAALACLDELVADALAHVPHCLTYLSELHTPEVFRFCAIPQLMAIATLADCLHNRRLFTGVVKIRKTLAVRMIIECTDMHAVRSWFASFARVIVGKARHSAAREQLNTAVNAILATCGADARASRGPCNDMAVCATTAVAFGGLAYSISQLSRRSRVDATGPFGLIPHPTETTDVILVAVAFACLAIVFAFAGVPLARSFLADLRSESASRKASDVQLPLALSDVPTSRKLGDLTGASAGGSESAT